MPFIGECELTITPASYRTWKLVNPIVYRGSRGDTFEIPAGYVTDFATVPRIFRGWLLDTYGPYTLAAIVHDWLLTHGIPLGIVSSRDADGLFRKIMTEEGVWIFTRWVMWAAVRVGALFNHERAPGRQFWKDAPAVIAIGALALIPCIAGVIGAGISMILLAPFRPRTRRAGR